MTAIVVAVLTVGMAVPWPIRAERPRRILSVIRSAPAPEMAEEKAEENTAAEAADGPRSVVLPDNGDLRRKLEQVRGQIEAQQYADATRQLGQFLQDAGIRDFFLSRDDARRDGRSFQSEIRRLLRELPAEGQTAYRAQFEPAARSSLSGALARGGESALREVALRFPDTQAGDEALYRLGHLLWDHGRVAAAAACLDRLASRPEAASAFEPGMGRLAVACREKLENPVAAADNWLSFRGDASRNRAVAARAPFLAPRWSHPASADSHTQLAIERGSRSYAQGSATALPMLSPLAVGSLVFTRTAHGVAAFDLETGQCRWRHPADDDGENRGLDRILWHEPAGGALSADEECVYLVDEMQPGDAASGGASQNVLSAREHFRSREGNLRWQVGGTDGGAEPRLAGAFFLGPVLGWQGRLYGLVESKGSLSLVVLDRANGRLEWSQELAHVELGISNDLLRMVAGATPSITPEEIIVCPTSGGAVVALDLTTQSLLWGYRYARQSVSETPVIAGETENAPRLDQFDRWLDATVSIWRGCVIIASPESREIHCLDLRTGEPKWSKPRSDGLFVACAGDEHVVVVGRRRVVGLRTVDGAAAWDRPYPDGAYPAGRGVFSGDRYFLPVTTAAVLEIDVATGKLVGDHKSPRELPAGNLIWHQGLFISQGPSALEAFDEREWLVGQVRARLETNARDPEALIRNGELELAANRVAEGIAAFRAAHEAARSPKTKARLISSLLEGIRQKLPESAALSDELDALIGP